MSSQQATNPSVHVTRIITKLQIHADYKQRHLDVWVASFFLERVSILPIKCCKGAILHSHTHTMSTKSELYNCL